MKLAVKPVASGSYTELCDESSRTDTLELFQPDFSRAAQIASVFRAASVETFDRGNASVGVQVICTVTYATKAAALASLLTFAELFSEKFHLRLTQDATIHYYPHAVCQSYTPSLVGTTIRHSLKFTSQQLTEDEPA